MITKYQISQAKKITETLVITTFPKNESDEKTDPTNHRNYLNRAKQG